MLSGFPLILVGFIDATTSSANYIHKGELTITAYES